MYIPVCEITANIFQRKHYLSGHIYICTEKCLDEAKLKQKATGNSAEMTSSSVYHLINW